MTKRRYRTGVKLPLSVVLSLLSAGVIMFGISVAYLLGMSGYTHLAAYSVSIFFIAVAIFIAAVVIEARRP